MDSLPFSFAVNVIGIGASVMPLLGIFFYRSHLPTPKFQVLDQLLNEAEGLYTSSIEANLLPEGPPREEIENRLAICREESYSYRRRAYSAITLAQQYLEFFSGLSFAINRTSTQIKEIRAQIIICNETERGRLRDLGDQEPTRSVSSSSERSEGTSTYDLVGTHQNNLAEHGRQLRSPAFPRLFQEAGTSNDTPYFAEREPDEDSHKQTSSSINGFHFSQLELASGHFKSVHTSNIGHLGLRQLFALKPPSMPKTSNIPSNAEKFLSMSLSKQTPFFQSEDERRFAQLMLRPPPAIPLESSAETDLLLSKSGSPHSLSKLAMGNVAESPSSDMHAEINHSSLPANVIQRVESATSFNRVYRTLPVIPNIQSRSSIPQLEFKHRASKGRKKSKTTSGSGDPAPEQVNLALEAALVDPPPAYTAIDPSLPISLFLPPISPTTPKKRHLPHVQIRAPVPPTTDPIPPKLQRSNSLIRAVSKLRSAKRNLFPRQEKSDTIWSGCPPDDLTRKPRVYRSSSLSRVTSKFRASKQYARPLQQQCSEISSATSKSTWWRRSLSIRKSFGMNVHAQTIA